MKMKRFISIALVLILLFSLASCGVKDDINPDYNSGSEKTQETQSVEEKPVIKPDDNEKKDEEEEVDDRPDDPPFVKTFRTGVYGCEYRTEANDGVSPPVTTFIYSDGTLVAGGYFKENGEVVASRYICDYETNEVYSISDSFKRYTVFPDSTASFFLMYGLSDYRDGMEQTGHGTADCSGETLDYIDYISGEVEIRFFIKDGDAYAMRHPEGDTFIFILTNTYSSPPTAEYSIIPDDYEKAELKMPTPPG